MKTRTSLSDSRPSRRQLLGAAAALGAVLPGLAGAAGSPATDAHPPEAGSPPVPAAGRGAAKTFVLVHGAWHGGWCWRKVVPLLRQAGHEVYAPTLSGLGDRGHELSRGIDLAAHIKDVVELLYFEDLRDVILVGHSYAGMVITGVAAEAADRLGQLVYLDAFVPKDGQSGFDNLSPKIRESWRRHIAQAGEGWKIPPLLNAAAMGITEPAEAAWLDARLRPQPVGTFEQPARFSEAKLAKLGRSYLRCAGFGGFGPTAQRVREQGWDVQEVPGGHDAMVAQPAELARALLARAGR